MTKFDFLNWWMSLEHDVDDLDWVVSNLVNDDHSTDEEMLQYFTENGFDEVLAKELIDHRTGFMNYGLHIT
jgi:hypothetical protein